MSVMQEQDMSAIPSPLPAMTGRLKCMHWGAREVEEWKEQTEKKKKYREELLEQMEKRELEGSREQDNICRNLFAERADDESETSVPVTPNKR